MAKKAKGGPNKSAAIREYKAANTAATPKEIAEALSKTGLSVSAQFVSTVLSNAKKKGGKVGKRAPKPGRREAAQEIAVVSREQSSITLGDIAGVEIDLTQPASVASAISDTTVERLRTFAHALVGHIRQLSVAATLQQERIEIMEPLAIRAIKGPPLIFA